MSSIEVKAEQGKVNVRFPILGGRRYRMGITPARARSLSLELQRAAEEAETLLESGEVEETPWDALARWLRRFGGDRA